MHHVEVVAQRQVLIDDLDAERVGLPGPGDVDLLALEEHLAAVERVDADDRLDQRALAGAVVAHQRRDLHRKHVEVDAAQDVNGAEALVHLAQGQQRVGRPVGVWWHVSFLGRRECGGRRGARRVDAAGQLTPYFSHAAFSFAFVHNAEACT